MIEQLKEVMLSFNYDEQNNEVYECFEGVGIFNTKREALEQVKKWNWIDNFIYGGHNGK